MKPEDMEEAVRLYKENDPGLDQFLTDHGVTNVKKWRTNVKARYGAPDITVATVKIDGPIRIETPEAKKVEVVETPEKSRVAMKPVPPPFEYKTTGISTAIGDFQYYKRNDYLDWTPIGNCNDTVSLKVEEWKELLKVLPEAAKVLEVDINGR
jgi:hypothetical protein